MAPIKVNFSSSYFLSARDHALADHQIKFVVFHRRIKLFFNRRIETMNLVDEKHVALLQVGQLADQVAGNLDRRGRRSNASTAPISLRDDVCERGFAKSGRAGEQNVIERFLAIQRCFHIDAKVFLHLPLADVVRELGWDEQSIPTCCSSAGSAFRMLTTSAR